MEQIPVLLRHEGEDTHGRLFKRKQVVVQIKCFPLILRCHCIDHIENVVRDLRHTDGIHIFPRNDISIQTVAGQLLQFLCDILHICSDFVQEIGDIRLRHLLFLLPDQPGDPFPERVLVLGAKLHDMPLRFHSLVQPAPLIHFIFYENKMGRLWHTVVDIIRQIISSVLKEPGILKHDQPALRKERQCLCQIDDLFDIRLLPFIIGIVHRIPFRDHRFYEALLILFLQISLRSVQEIDLSKLSRFQIFIQAFHNSCIIKEGNPV